MTKHPLGIPQITLDDHIKQQSYQRMLIWAQEKANADALMRDALTRKAFNHGLCGKEYNQREHKHDN